MAFKRELSLLEQKRFLGYTRYLLCKNHAYEKKIDKSIDFLRGLEEKMVSIFRLGSCGKVELSLGPNEAVSEIYT